jgi:hypothetical protein
MADFLETWKWIQVQPTYFSVPIVMPVTWYGSMEWLKATANDE